MIRWSAFLWCVVALVMAVVVFQIKYKVQELETHLAAANADILSEQEKIQVLRAEWSYLNRPARISELAQRYLKTGPDGQPATLAAAQLDAIPLQLEGVVQRGPGAGPLLPKPKPIIQVAAPSDGSPARSSPAGSSPPVQAPSLLPTFASFGGTQ
jgi:cell division protein FtsL